MPSIYTHYIFKDSLPGDHSLIGNVGAQGPDPFFFNFATLNNNEENKKVTSLGHFMHKINPISFFSYFGNYIKKIVNKDEKTTLINYMKGMISHYVLDVTCHPFIFYESGFPTPEDNDEKKYAYSHSAIETSIDTILKHDLKYKKKSSSTLKCKKKELMQVSKMYYSYFKDVHKFAYVKLDSFYKAVKRMKMVYFLIHSQFGFKKWIFSHTVKVSLLNVFCMGKYKNVPKLDFLNLEHNAILDPCDENKVHHKDFYQLLDDSKAKYEVFINRYIDDLENKDNFDDLNELISDLDHDGKKVNSQMKNFDLIWAKLK